MIRPVGTQPMETPRLILRRFAPGDETAMFKNWAGDPQVCRYLAWGPHESVQESRGLIGDWIKEYKDPRCFRWGIVLKNPDLLIGSIEVINLKEEAGEGELRFCISRRHWGQGIAFEAFHAVLVYLFVQAGFESVTARHDARDPASGAVMRKNGLRFAGKESFTHRDETEQTAHCYRITKTEFETI